MFLSWSPALPGPAKQKKLPLLRIHCLGCGRSAPTTAPLMNARSSLRAHRIYSHESISIPTIKRGRTNHLLLVHNIFTWKMEDSQAFIIESCLDWLSCFINIMINIRDIIHHHLLPQHRLGGLLTSIIGRAHLPLKQTNKTILCCDKLRRKCDNENSREKMQKKRKVNLQT